MERSQASTELAKHGLDLADAERFDFDNAAIEEDRDVKHEQRFRAIGWTDDRLCYLVYTLQNEGVHAISLRLADRKDRRNYEKKLQRGLHG